ncbi:hypothetical protein FRB95_010223 [Tulasnella sp. JGI-2019a]|nr:hypothetical protein FRB95_010223 [Tulasnella sp. JGI-2019a]
MASIIQEVKIDGSYLGGGGQVLRNSFVYSALLSNPVVIERIRHHRTPPGLKPQHAEGLKLVSKISVNSKLTGAIRRSSEVQFEPGTIIPGNYSADPGTAGSTVLLLQVSLPCLLFPSWRGYFSRGGGEIFVTVPPVASAIPAITLVDRGPVIYIKGKAHVSGVLPQRMNHIAAEAARDRLRAAGFDSLAVDIEEVEEPRDRAEGNGSGLLLWAETHGGCLLGGSSIGEKSKQTYLVGEEAAEMLITNLAHGGCVDEHLQDQIIIFMALAEGTSTVVCGPLSLHTQTAIWIAETMTDAKFTVTEADGRCTITCSGIGLRAKEGQMAVL